MLVKLVELFLEELNVLFIVDAFVDEIDVVYH